VTGFESTPESLQPGGSNIRPDTRLFGGFNNQIRVFNRISD
jgi:hypothetical protein